MRPVTLPLNESGYYEIRLESIGGLGANLCGKMLGELGLRYLGCNSASFSSYGSEKTGTPVKAYIRYCAYEKEIRVHSPVEHPQLLVIFHEALLRDRSAVRGCTRDTVIVLNTKRTADRGLSKEIAGLTGGVKEIYVVDAGKIAMETHARVNVVMLGAAARAAGFIEPEDACRICRDTLGKKYPDVLNCNLEGIRRGFEEAVRAENTEEMTAASSGASGTASEEAEMPVKAEDTLPVGDHFPVWGYRTAPAGGINPLYGNSVLADLSPSRQGYIPVFLQERCINCALCDSSCPDMVFQFARGVYKGREMMVNRGLDYYHCKGCLRCVAVCPTHALVRGAEEEHPQKTWFLPNQELLRRPDYYEKTGPDGYITSESYLTEKQIEGGEV